MTLVAISLAPPGYDLRAFECAKCDRTATKVVPTDLMKTGDVLRWLNGELGRPTELSPIPWDHRHEPETAF
jgi:hypothetical protein